MPAYNAQEFIAESLRSAIAQTWKRTEIIVVDDGSTDRTAEIARGCASKGVTVVSTKNGGLSAAQNEAFRHSQGDYIQWFDSDDLLAPDKIERQLAALRDSDSKRTLLSSPWAPFYYRARGARFVRNSLWRDLSPVEWLLRLMGENLHMQNATWLVSRELTEAAGPWNEALKYDQDGEYFTRVLVASEGTRFVPGTGIYYRSRGSSQLSYVGNSDKKKESLLVSMKLHIQYLRSLEESDRVRKACVAYMQNWFGCFYPDRPDLVAELQSLAAQFGGQLEPPRLPWKYAWMKPVLGRKAARRAQTTLPLLKTSCLRRWDKAMFRMGTTLSANSDELTAKALYDHN
jgi:glycosyltransferase involved in cell wall biosynthesis